MRTAGLDGTTRSSRLEPTGMTAVAFAAGPSIFSAASPASRKAPTRCAACVLWSARVTRAALPHWPRPNVHPGAVPCTPCVAVPPAGAGAYVTMYAADPVAIKVPSSLTRRICVDETRPPRRVTSALATKC